MQKEVRPNRIRIDAIALALYFASTPIHQTLLLSNGATITKYLAFASMLTIIFVEMRRCGTYRLQWNVAQPLVFIMTWFGMSVLWTYSTSATISSIISITSYFALMVMVCSKEWTDKEKKLFMLSLVAACIYYSFTLIQDVGSVKRATFISDTGQEADQNLLAVNIAMGALFAFHLSLTCKKQSERFFMIMSVLFMVVAIICTGSRGGLIALLAGLFFYINQQKKAGNFSSYRSVISLALLLGVVYYVLTSGILGNDVIVSRYIGDEAANASNRTVIWSRYFSAMIHRPFTILLGAGYGAETRFYADYYATNWPPATHNDIVCVLCNSGIVGLVLVWNMVRNIWKKAKYNNNNLGLACIILVIVGGLSIDSVTRYGWWNAMIFAYIGIGVKSHERYRK